MSLEADFRTLQKNVNADPRQVDEARERRRMFQRALHPDVTDEITETVPTGSLARGSQIEPINDVDLLAVFDPDKHPDWGQPGGSAEQALEHARSLIKDLLGSAEKLEELFGPEGQKLKWVRHTRLQNHAVKCFLDDPDDPDAFTVDVVPALLRGEGGFYIPERTSLKWIATDPVELIRRVLERHTGFGEGQFVQLIRVLKRWSRDQDKVLSGLALEVLALRHLPDRDRPGALASFFQSALEHIWEPIEDPAGLCGEVQPKLDRQAAANALEQAADLSARAVTATARGELDTARCLWWKLLGDVFPKPSSGCGEEQSNGSAAAGAAGVAIVGGRKVRDVQEG